MSGGDAWEGGPCALDKNHPVYWDIGLEFRLYSIFCLAFALCVFKVVLERIVKRNWTTFELTDTSLKAGDTKENFPSRVSLNLIGIIFHAHLGVRSAYYAYSYMYNFAPELGVVLFVNSTVPHCYIIRQIAYCGTLFTGYAVFQVMCLLLRWEKGVEAWLHHLIFVVVAFAAQRYCTTHEISVLAMSMELSTPPLLAMLTLRRLKGYEHTVARIQKIFFYFFAFCRPGMFTVAIARGLYVFLYHRHVFYYAEAEEIRVPTNVLYFIYVVYTLGLFLQYYWFVGIVRKALRATKKMSAIKKVD